MAANMENLLETQIAPIAPYAETRINQINLMCCGALNDSIPNIRQF